VSLEAHRRRCPVSPARVAILAVMLTLSCSATAFAEPRTADAAGGASSAAAPPRITQMLKNLANTFARIEFRRRYKSASESTVGRLTKKAVTKWVKKEAKECPDPLPKLYFCNRPQTPTWGRGIAIGIRGRWVPEYRSPWSPRNSPQVLRPGVMFWLTCWSAGTRLDYGSYTSNLWYRLTNGLYVNDGQLSTGTDYAIPGVVRCS
jgi:hypothetical protein